jgi:hypothetical protein
MDWDHESLTMTVQPAQYSDQIVTNHKRALEQRLDGVNWAVKELAYERDGTLLPFRRSPMSNTLGIAGAVLSLDGKWIIGLRAARLAFDPGTWGCAASGALEWSEPENWLSDFHSGNWMKDALARECEEELGYRPSASEIEYLGLAREFGRAGKPQLFFLIRCGVDSSTLRRFWQVYASEDNELVELKILSGEEVRGLVGNDESVVARILDGGGLTDEVRMNLALALRFLDRFDPA